MLFVFHDVFLLFDSVVYVGVVGLTILLDMLTILALHFFVPTTKGNFVIIVLIHNPLFHFFDKNIMRIKKEATLQ